jgi:iron complex outermembrane receptor protein
LQKANSFRNFVKSDVVYINPSLQINPTSKTTILLEGDYLKSNNTPDFGAGVINYKIISLPRDRFTGVSWGRYYANQSMINSKLTHNWSKSMSMNIQSAFRYYKTDLFTNVRPNSIDVKSDGSWSRSIQRTQIEDLYWIQQIDLKLSLQTGKLKHQLLIGFDAEQMRTLNTNFNIYKNYDQINVFDEYKNANEVPIPALTKNTRTNNPVVRFGIYAQDYIQISKQIKLMIGGRLNKIKTESDVYTYSTSTNEATKKIENPFSPKIAFVYQPNSKTSVFSSYSNSFTINTGIDINGNNLKPSVIDQIEIGLKKKWYNGKIQVNTTCYLINNSNLAQTALLNGNTYSNFKELAGATRSVGVEIDAKFEPINNLNIMFGYSFNETKYTKSNIYIVGSELKYNPKNTANISMTYDVEKGIFKNMNFGLIFPYVGTRYGGRSTRLTVDNDILRLIKLNDYWLVDINLGYSYKKIKLSGKISNLFNVLNYNIHDDNSLNPISPVNFSAQATLVF